MKIRTVPMSHDWIVTADWYGAERIVFTGTLFGCLRFVRAER